MRRLEMKSFLRVKRKGRMSMQVSSYPKTMKMVTFNQGPILSANKKLAAEKLAEEEAERKVKGEAKKEKQRVGEKGHVKPATYLDSNEKFLIGVATKGVVKLFNAVNKAQHAQKGLNPSRAKDVKAINKRRKEAFFSELGKTILSATNSNAKLRHIRWCSGRRRTRLGSIA